MRSSKVFAVVSIGAAFALPLAGCANSERFAAAPKETSGTVAGAALGAIVGSQIGGSTRSRVAAGVAGALLGGLIGNRIGAALDDEDRQRAYEAQMAALESGAPGAPVGWENPDSGRRGSIVPGPYYDRRGMRCRDYTHTIYIDGRPEIARGQACRNPDGSWTPVT
jgi:surface antigen